MDQGIYWDATKGGGNLVANCVVEHNRAEGIALYPSPAGVLIENNTIVNNENYGMVVYGSQNVIVNNIFSNNGNARNGSQMKINSGSNHIIDSNIFWSLTNSQQGYISGTGQVVTHSLIIDPQFVDPASHNYHLQPGSAATHIGNTSYTRPEDKDGVPTAVPYLGAYGKLLRVVKRDASESEVIR